MRPYRVVVGIDGSSGGERALFWAARHARAHEGSVRAVMVYDWPKAQSAVLAGRGRAQEQRRVEQLVEDLIAEVRREFRGVPITAETMAGTAGRTLAEAAAESDLLVVGDHGHNRLHHSVLGSVSEKCVRLASCPVAVIPMPRANPADSG